MKRCDVKNMPASVHGRLLNRAREEHRPFDELLQYYAMERFLYRVSRSKYRSALVLKGALMIVAWDTAVSRPTRDIDFLANVSNDVEAIEALVREVCLQEVEDDGMVFHVDTVSGESITAFAEYQGVRVKLEGRLGTARVHMQLDFGFGDIVIPSPTMLTYPGQLDMPTPELLGYSMESLIAEKLETIARLGLLNSRIKDFYDIWLLSRQHSFEGEVLQQATEETFRNRGTELGSSVVRIINDLSKAATTQEAWRAFCSKKRLELAPTDFSSVAENIIDFVGPVVVATEKDNAFISKWGPSGPWTG
ncbi:MAG: nucleotidyl transferase AbiEii/AbiGii toxin family protein [Actinobacteria bacterium]|nr:nucleotidyl transferase AbiEii/AbiGii toxin family protein [Actinomycetota bacterium]MCG2819538.1 nucleotidyl transferase AbiEii/AbiGii toxin family protein [Actinomycetes bacterium]MBU4178948.1 nucleotidyl transferase AbiEii/AbiGii toxin family protein [Actinomycetota bacterium]MBU4218806.1 nucleotidyl transferase AbiEii/AbiGii toxin family protein [Actinomycetota bacterium]MBU4360224.1 nucleotidyl transferase AbiEii/AbiGii toxin family protein [Actinomycetota bacterium]